MSKFDEAALDFSGILKQFSRDCNAVDLSTKLCAVVDDQGRDLSDAERAMKVREFVDKVLRYLDKEAPEPGSVSDVVQRSRSRVREDVVDELVTGDAFKEVVREAARYFGEHTKVELLGSGLLDDLKPVHISLNCNYEWTLEGVLGCEIAKYTEGATVRELKAGWIVSPGSPNYETALGEREDGSPFFGPFDPAIMEPRKHR